MRELGPTNETVKGPVDGDDERVREGPGYEVMEEIKRRGCRRMTDRLMRKDDG